MGELAVLQPQDCLKEPLSHKTLFYDPMKKSRRKFQANANPKPTKSNRRKRSPPRLNDKRNDNNKSGHPVVANFPAKNLIVGQVKILKRGEELKESTETKDRASEVNEKVLKVEDLDGLVLSSTDRLGPEPEMVPKQVKITDFYAGSAFIESPPPSSLPFPAFFTKKSALTMAVDATSDLRRILRLDLH